ncbi:hypothetical protein [Tumebacillus sp. BK434]|nr:hypothetical protein [Tumebacillus sp. BK434]
MSSTTLCVLLLLSGAFLALLSLARHPQVAAPSSEKLEIGALI